MSDIEIAAELERLSHHTSPAPWSIASGYQHAAYRRDGGGVKAKWISWGIPDGDTNLICFMRNNLDRIIERLRDR